MIRLIIALIPAFISIVVCAQSPVQTIDFRNDHAVFCDIAYDANKGLLLAGVKPDGKDLVLIFLDKELKQKWKIVVDNEDYGYLDPTVNSKDLYAYFSGENIFVFYPSSNTALKNAFYLMEIDRSGNIKKSIYKPEATEKFMFPYLEADIFKVLIFNKISPKEKEYLQLVYVPTTGNFQKKVIRFPEVLPGSPNWTGTDFIMHAFNGGYKGQNKIVSYFTRVKPDGELLSYKNISIDFPEKVYPCPDVDMAYGTSSSSSYFTSPLSRLLIYPQGYLYYGMYASDESLSKKAGIYLTAFDEKWVSKFQKIYSFEKLESSYPGIKVLLGKKMFFTGFTSMDGYYFYTFKNVTKNEAAGIILDSTGNILNAFPGKSTTFTGRHRYSLSFASNLNFSSGLSTAFTSPEAWSYLGVKMLKGVVDEAVEKDHPLNLIKMTDRNYLVKYIPEKEELEFYILK